jgi:soluble lytic murein transglycosylase
MQLMPETARDLASGGQVDARKFPPDQLSDPAVNIEYGTAYLRYLVSRYHEIEAALSAYNAGLRHVDVWAKKGGDIRAAIEFPETKRYVLKVVRGRDKYQTLYPNSFNQ